MTTDVRRSTKEPLG